MMTEEEAERLKAGMKPGEEDEGIKQIGSVNPIEDFKKMITKRFLIIQLNVVNLFV